MSVAPVDRLGEHARAWRVNVEGVLETATSVIAFGTREVTASENQSVVLKVIRQPGDEWCSGNVLAAFNGQGVARAYEHEPGAVLLERLRPGNSLVDLTLNGRDEEATDILADVIQQMTAHASSRSSLELPQACATVEDWGKSFHKYIATGDVQIPRDLVEAGRRVFENLCASERRPRLLHGDLHPTTCCLILSVAGWQLIPRASLEKRSMRLARSFVIRLHNRNCFFRARPLSGGSNNLPTD